MCEHWLPLEIANVSLSFLLQMLHVKNTNWTLRFGAVASKPANLFNIGLASGHKRKAAMDVKVFGLCLYPRFLSVCSNGGLESILCEAAHPQVVGRAKALGKAFIKNGWLYPAVNWNTKCGGNKSRHPVLNTGYGSASSFKSSEAVPLLQANLGVFVGDEVC
jgi:hypothetical protein